MWKVFFTKKWLTSYIQREHQPTEYKPNLLKMRTTGTKLFFLRNKNTTTTLTFQHMNITPMLVLVQETLVKPIACSKCLKK